jgi:hypothetical protein
MLTPKHLRLTLTLSLLLGACCAVSPGLVAGEEDPFADLMKKGYDAKDRREWKAAADHFGTALQLAQKTGTVEEQSRAALQAALSLKALFADDPTESTEKSHSRLVAYYQAVIDLETAPASDRELACNNLGVFYMRTRQRANALRTFAKVADPARPDAQLYHYNWGRALLDDAQSDEAAFHFWKALEKDARMKAAADRLFQAVLRKPGQYVEATRLLDFLLKQSEAVPPGTKGNSIKTGYEQAVWTGAYVRKLLEEWEPTDKADGLFARLLRSYELAGIDPTAFDKEQDALAGVVARDEGYAKLVAELRLLFLGNLSGPQEKPIFENRDQVADRFPKWSRIWKDSAARESFSRVLKQAADHYYQQSVTRPGREKGPNPAANEAARQTLARYTAAYALDARNSEAAVYAVTTVSEHFTALGGERLLKTLTELMVGQKSELMAEVKQHPDDEGLWRALFRCHVILGGLADNRHRWGPESDKQSALYFYGQASKEEAEILKRFDKGALPAAWLQERLANAQFNSKDELAAIKSYRDAAEGFIRTRAPRQATEALDAAKAIAGRHPKAWAPFDAGTILGRLREVNDNAAKVHELASLSLPHRALGATFVGDCESVVWGDGKRAYQAPADCSKQPLPIPMPTKADISRLSVSRDGRRLAGAAGPDVVVLDLKGMLKEKVISSERKMPVQALALSPDGNQLVTADRGGVVLWDVPKGVKLRTLESPTRDPVTRMAFSRSGNLLAGAVGQRVAVWDLERGTRKDFLLEGHVAPIYGLSFTPKGEKDVLATASGDSTTRLWDAASGKHEATLQGQKAAMTATSFSPDGKLLAVGTSHGVVALWDVERRKELAWLTPGRGNVTSVNFDHNRKRVVVGLASADGRGELKVWDVSELAASGD